MEGGWDYYSSLLARFVPDYGVASSPINMQLALGAFPRCLAAFLGPPAGPCAGL